MSLTKRLMELDNELPEVDAEAFSDPATCEVDDDWLRGAEPKVSALAPEASDMCYSAKAWSRKLCERP